MLELLKNVGDPRVREDGLRSVDRWARRVAATPWFGRVGCTLLPDHEKDAIAYARALGCVAPTIQVVQGWSAARRIAQSPDMGSKRRADAAEVGRLDYLALSRYAPGLVAAIVDETSGHAADHALGAAANVAARHALRDGEVVRLAAEDAGRAFRQASFAVIAGEVQHAFLLRLRLFVVGHWPLGLFGDSVVVF